MSLVEKLRYRLRALVAREELDGELTLRESPWDPIASLLPQRELVSARLDTPTFLGRDITLEGSIDPEGFWPHVDTIGGSRWPGP